MALGGAGTRGGTAAALLAPLPFFSAAGAALGEDTEAVAAPFRNIVGLVRKRLKQVSSQRCLMSPLRTMLYLHLPT